MTTLIEIVTEVDCPDFFLDWNPGGWVDLVYDDEIIIRKNRLYIESVDTLSEANWISLSRNFIRSSKTPPKPILH